jgi:hypothetical protein
MIDNTLFQKITVPLQKVLQTYIKLEQSDDFIQFEMQLEKEKQKQLRESLENMSCMSELIAYRFSDMRDWSMLNKGTF